MTPPQKSHSDEYVSLRDYIDTLDAADRERTALQFDAMERAVEVAFAANTKRFEGVNELRAMAEDQAKRFASNADLGAFREKMEAELKNIRTSMSKDVDSLKESIESLKLSRATLEGKASQNSVIIAYLIGLVGIVIGIFRLFV
jgi:uncharacterized protein involved in exopolysaccharide biosynthesis